MPEAAIVGTNEMQLSGAQKAAIVIRSLDADGAGAILKALPEEEVEAITAAIDGIREIPEELRMRALQEFYDQMKRSSSGGDSLTSVLEKSLGKEKSDLILSRIRTNRNEGKYFEYLLHLDIDQIAAVLRTERPQTLALIFSQLEPKRAAEILAKFDAELQSQVIVRIGHMERVAPEFIAKLHTTLRKRLGSAPAKMQALGGPKLIAQVLNNVDRDTEKRLIESLQNKDAGLFTDVKKMMLVFDDLSTLPDKSAQAILREVEMSDLTLALKGASQAMKDLIGRNLSSRAAERLKEEMELMGPKPRSEVQQAQERVIAVVRRLEEEGKIKLSRGGGGGGDDELVS
jgi:flagellar motor switch protein FliG